MAPFVGRAADLPLPRNCDGQGAEEPAARPRGQHRPPPSLATPVRPRALRLQPDKAWTEAQELTLAAEPGAGQVVVIETRRTTRS
jgi:hypothetical protein